MKLRNISAVDLAEILRLHKLWLMGNSEGKQADLQSANLRSADLQFADLWSANLRSANLRSANLRSANLQSADLQFADLQFADLQFADLQSADLRFANLQSANLQSANLRFANLQSADLRFANLRSALNIPPILYAETSIISEGELVGWKKCNEGKIVKLKIPNDARRSNATGRKCRAEFAEVLAIFNSDGSPSEVASSLHMPSFHYTVGAIVRANGWCEDRWVECAGGIHFFITKIEAENFMM